MTTDTNQDNDCSVSESVKQLNSASISNPIPISTSSTVPATINLPISSLCESLMPVSNASHPGLKEASTAESPASFNRLQTAHGLPVQTASPVMCTTPPSVSPSSSSAFKVVPQRQKNLSDSIEGM